MRRRHYVKGKAVLDKVVLLGLDLLLYHAGIVVAFWIRFLGPAPSYNFWSYRDLAQVGKLWLGEYVWIPVPGYLWLMPPVVFLFFGMQSVRWSRARVEDFMVVLRAMLATTVLLVVGIHVYRPETSSFPTSVLVISYFTCSGLLLSWRAAAREMYVSRGRKARPRRLLIVGGSPAERPVIEKLLQNEDPSYEVAGCLTAPEGERDAEPPVRCDRLGNVTELEEVLERQAVDEVLIVPSNLGTPGTLEVMKVCERRGLAYRYLPDLMDVFISGAKVGLVNFVPTIQFGKANIEGWNAIFKRTFDAAVALTVLALTSWLMAFAAVWIVFDSPGPPLFVQERVGRYGRRFKMLKFRTMLYGAEMDSPLTLANDPRVTKAGMVLRRLSIDELPQLVNVLLGEMSLVGPRAVVPYVAERFNELEKMTLNVPPGMTGLAQVSGRDELGFRDKSLLNLYYIRNYSLLLDLQVLLRTIAAVVRGTGTDGTRVE